MAGLGLVGPAVDAPAVAATDGGGSFLGTLLLFIGMTLLLEVVATGGGSFLATPVVVVKFPHAGGIFPNGFLTSGAFDKLLILAVASEEETEGVLFPVVQPSEIKGEVVTRPKVGPADIIAPPARRLTVPPPATAAVVVKVDD